MSDKNPIILEYINSKEFDDLLSTSSVVGEFIVTVSFFFIYNGL